MSGDTALLQGRVGAPRFSALAPDVLAALNAGHVATVNLVEFLAIDMAQLARNLALHIGLDPSHERLVDTLSMLGAFKPMRRHDHVARALYDMALPRADRDAVAHALATHPSDMARCWAAHWLVCSDQSLGEKLVSVRRFATDDHFGVREMAWSAVRNDVIASLDEALELLVPWIADDDANIRRFASELTRPRGVWCAQIDALKAEPWRALALLEPLKADPSRYVQNSVANWLNDASKSQPAWVQQVCAQWERESTAPATRYITRRALRTLVKSKKGP
jgi:3-methyladenine DNA glycosylase AlkC